MSEESAKEPREMPKGGRKGGKRFPQYSLKDTVKWADKLVSKTHNGPQPEDLIMAGVVEAKSGTGNVRISALRQFDLMAGTSKGYTATELAKEIRSAPPDEKVSLYRRAALKPEVFRAIYATFQSDAVTVAKLRQRAADLHVHPDSTSKCVDIYIETMEFADLLSRDGDMLVHDKGEAAEKPIPEEISADEEPISDNQGVQQEGEKDETIPENVGNATRRGVATVQVNISLDSSLDTEKLQKQLELLRRYGAI